MRGTTTIKKRVQILCVCTAFLTGLLIDYNFGNKLDYWIHDAAVVFQHRTEWKYSGIVVLDDGVPFSVGRKQALPLFAKATEQLIQAGANGVFLDARVPKELEGRMPYAKCIEKDGSVQWSMPICNIVSEKQCQINHSDLGNAPLKMNKSVVNYFSIAPYLNDNNNLPDFLLYDWEMAEAIPAEGLVVSDRLVTFDSPVARWLDLSKDHAVYKLVEYSQEKKNLEIFKTKTSDDLCGEYPCRRIRLSLPGYNIETQSGQLILPVSHLASCDNDVAKQAASLLKDKVVVLQITAPNESTDLVVTPMTTALLGPRLMTPGAQFLVDAVETVLNNDSPIPPSYPIKILLFICAAFFGVLAGMYFQQYLLWCLGVSIFIVLGLLCFFNPIIQLWPVVATMQVYILGVGQIVFVHLIVGLKEGKIVRQYMPKQIHNILMSLGINEMFQSRRCHVAILMSDLAGYTTVTGLLKEPELVLALMNDYLEQTSLVLQKKYEGILESYIGDMVCYYWTEEDQENRIQMYKNVLLGAIELGILQKQFFLTLAERYKNNISTESLQQILSIIDAGIGITVGNVVMGDLGPKHGIKKFGILGDPLNLVARIESLTRLFNTDIIIAGDFLDAVKMSNLVVRRLGSIKVKGRMFSETLYALGSSEDPRFSDNNIEGWSLWLEQVESTRSTSFICPDIYQKDMITINDWLNRNLLNADGIWYLDKK